MKTYDTRPDFYDMWCHSSTPYDYTDPKNTMNSLAADWRSGSATAQGAMENFFAHIMEKRPRGRHK